MISNAMNDSSFSQNQLRDQDESVLHSDSIMDVWVTTILMLMMKRQLLGGFKNPR